MSDTMDIDPVASSATAVKPEKKEKKHHHHKDKDSTSSKKRKHEAGAADAEHKKKKKDKSQKHESFLESEAATFSPKPKKTSKSKHAISQEPTTGSSRKKSASPYHTVTSSLYLPLSPISISPSHALSSLLSEHLSPLLLTYYPPFRGIILAYSNPWISSTPPTSPHDPHADAGNEYRPLTLATTAGEYGVMFVYLTATFLVFRPESGQVLEGSVNVQSEGFLGAVVNNLFTVGFDRKRLPKDWRYVAPGEDNGVGASGAPSVAGTEYESEGEKEGHGDQDPSVSRGPDSVGLVGNENSVASLEEVEDTSSGYFVTPSGKRVRGTIRFRVVDTDVVAGAERDKGFITIEGSMLSEEDEAALVAEERRKASGGKAVLEAGAVAAREQAPDYRMSGAMPVRAEENAEEQDQGQGDEMDVDDREEEVKKAKKEKKDKKEKKEKKSKKSSS